MMSDLFVNEFKDDCSCRVRFGENFCLLFFICERISFSNSWIAFSISGDAFFGVKLLGRWSFGFHSKESCSNERNWNFVRMSFRKREKLKSEPSFGGGWVQRPNLRFRPRIRTIVGEIEEFLQRLWKDRLTQNIALISWAGREKMYVSRL